MVYCGENPREQWLLMKTIAADSLNSGSAQNASILMKGVLTKIRHVGEACVFTFEGISFLNARSRFARGPGALQT